MLLSAALTLFASPALQDADWPEYRGPNHDGVVPDASLPLTWSEEENVTWKTPIHGRGWSSPVIQDGRIWLTTATPEGEKLSVLALSAETGEVLVDRVVFEIEEPEHRNKLNSYASPSPVAGGGRVFISFGTYGLACLDGATGKSLWERRDLNCDHMEGPGSSPLLHDGRLVLHVDGGDVQFIVCLDAESGETLWKTERSIELSELAPDLRKAYSTPVVVEVDGEEQLVSSAARGTYGYDPKTGAELWRIRHIGFSMSSRPCVTGDHVVISTGFMRPELLKLKLGGTGDVTESHIAWRNTRGAPTMPSPVAHEGRLFQVSDRGMASCVDLDSGETLWQERLGAEVCASPILAGGRLYYFDRDGTCTVVEPGPTFRKLAESHLASGFMASPAVLGDALVLRTEEAVYRIEGPQED